MKEFEITVYNKNTKEPVDEFVAEFENIEELYSTMENVLHNYDEPYFDLDFTF